MCLLKIRLTASSISSARLMGTATLTQSPAGERWQFSSPSPCSASHALTLSTLS